MLIYSASDLKSLVEYLKDFDYKYEPIYTVFEDWLNESTPGWSIQGELQAHFPAVYDVLFRVPYEELSLYTKEPHEGAVAAWRLVRGVRDELVPRGCGPLS
jgi:hypothetical protein